MTCAVTRASAASNQLGFRAFARSVCLLQLCFAIGTRFVPAAVAEPRSLGADAKAVSAKIIEMIHADSTELSINGKRARVGDIALNGSIVKTGYARAALEFGSDAVLRMGRATEVKIGGPCFYLSLGIALSSGSSDICLDSLDIDSPQTNYIVQVMPSKRTVITVLEGTVRARLRDPKLKDDAGASAKWTVIRTGYEQTFTENSVLSTSRRLGIEDYIRILNGELFLGFKKRLPDQRELDEVIKKLRGGGSRDTTIKAGPGDQYGF